MADKELVNTWSWMEKQLREIFSIYGSHETLSTERLAMEIERRIETVESGSSDIPPMDQTTKY